MRPRPHPILLLALLAAALSRTPSPASADPRQEANMQAARAAFERAEVSFALGRFEEALAGYQQAYELQPKLAPLLFNIAQCHRFLKRWERAAFFYDAYVTRVPAAKNRQMALQLIAEMQAAQKKEEAERKEAERRAHEEKLVPPAAVATPPLTVATTPADVTATPAALHTELPPGARPPEMPPPAPSPPRPVYKKWWFWTVVGTVAAGAAAGISAAVALNPQARQIDSSLGWTLDAR